MTTDNPASVDSLTDEQMYDRMKKGWQMGRPFTVCGNGSTLGATKAAREWLPVMVKKYGIQSVNDAGAGDMAWIRKVDWNVDYLPFDLIPRLPEVTKWDITKEALPPCDAILCRMVLNHLQERIDQTVPLLEASCKYLIATQYDQGPNRTKQFQRLDLRVYFGEPLESVNDGPDEFCTLAIWKI